MKQIIQPLNTGTTEIVEVPCPHVNGILCAPANPQSLAKAILRALEDESLRQQAAVRNQEPIAKRADCQTVMAGAEKFYRQVITDARESRS